MSETNNNFLTSTPLVRERSKVQSFPAAPESPMKSGISDNTENPLTTFRDATEREHAPSRRAGSVRDVLEAFEAWADRQVLTPDAARHVAHIINYLIMAERRIRGDAGMFADVAAE